MEPTHVTPAFPGYPDFKPDDHAKVEAIWFERGQVPPHLRDVAPELWPVWAQKYRDDVP